MAQYDVHPVEDGVLVVDCQADTLSYLATRVVIPLLPRDRVPPAADHLHPILNVNGEALVLATQLMAAMGKNEMARPIGSLASERYTIIRAIDMLLTGA